jgi:hypothetical protein
MPSTEMGQSVNSAVSSMASYDQASGSMQIGISGISPRLLMSNVNNLRAIGIDIDMSNPVLNALRNVIIVNYSLLMLNSAYRTAIKAHAAREAALAVGETVATAASIVMSWKIPVALVASASVYAAFETGKKLGSGEWDLAGGDMSIPGDRRQMMGDLSGVM